MPDSSDKNLDQSVIGIIGREDFCKILSAKKVELRRQIQELTEKIKQRLQDSEAAIGSKSRIKYS